MAKASTTQDLNAVQLKKVEWLATGMFVYYQLNKLRLWKKYFSWGVCTLYYT